MQIILALPLKISLVWIQFCATGTVLFETEDR